MTIKSLRNSYNITLKEAAYITSVPIRTFIRYENDEKYGSKIKRNAIIDIIKNKYEITETKGILTIAKIAEISCDLFSTYNEEISFCYLFGSYAKGKETETSDVDLLVSTTLTGLNFVGLIEELRERLNKKVDLIRLSDLSGNIELIEEIMKSGIKIYG